nr:immunoglobulin light chain junction region [Macaca mulatta]
DYYCLILHNNSWIF